jgi:hypothetical protein
MACNRDIFTLPFLFSQFFSSSIIAKLHNEVFHNLYSSPNIIGMVRSRRMRWTGPVARMGRRGMHIWYWWESQKERERPLGRPRRRCVARHLNWSYQESGQGLGEQKSQKIFRVHNWTQTSKGLIPGPSAKRTKDLLKLNRRPITMGG